MKNFRNCLRSASFVVYALVLLMTSSSFSTAQDFNFVKLNENVKSFTVVIDMQIEVSFGINTSDQEERYLGTLVTEDGLVIFDGTALASDNLFSSFSGLTVKTTPTKINVTTLDGISYDGEYLGYDRFTKVGFLKILTPDKEKFTPVRFNEHHEFIVGEWLALYMLLPDFVTPPLSSDIGMVSNLVQSPEPFPLTVGFNSLQLTSVLFNESLEPIGILGSLMDPTTGTPDAGGMLESFGNVGIPLLGVVTADRLTELISSPPTKGKIERGWLGIALQALTRDLADFWNLALSGGIIVNEIIRNSPADKGGLEVGDIIYEVNGQVVDVDREEKVAVFQRLIASLGPGSAVELSVMRRKNEKLDSARVFVTLEKSPITPADAPDYEDKELEFTVRDLVFADYMIYNLDSENFTGVVVSELVLGGPASVSGLLIGDIIQRIGSEEINSAENAEAVLSKVSSNQPGEVIFFIWRRNKTMFVNVKPSWN